jgi:hypothetical protein
MGIARYNVVGVMFFGILLGDKKDRFKKIICNFRMDWNIVVCSLDCAIFTNRKSI